MRNGKKEIDKLMSYTKYAIKCPNCLHSILTTRKKVLCNWCGAYVYKDKKLEFEDKLKASLRRRK